jgi:hypothetical protein
METTVNASTRIIRCFALSALAASLAACAATGSGAQTAVQSHPVFSTVPGATVQQTNATALIDENLRANNAKIQPQNCGSLISRTTFTATGAASGTYPGTFTTTGVWGVRSLGGWYFQQQFTVDSPPYRVVGSIFFRGLGQSHVLWCYSLFHTAHFPYTATVTKLGKSMKQIAGNAAVFKIEAGVLHEELGP